MLVVNPITERNVKYQLSRDLFVICGECFANEPLGSVQASNQSISFFIKDPFGTFEYALQDKTHKIIQI